MRRPGAHREIPPPLELECLKTLWALGEGNVQAVRTALAPARALAYTTVMTVLDRLARKGILSRRKVSRSFLYTPAVTRDTLRRAAVRELAANFFDGSEEAIVAYLRSEPAPRSFVPESEEGLDTALL
jgi:predicted transcriptional regulator